MAKESKPTIIECDATGGKVESGLHISQSAQTRWAYFGIIVGVVIVVKILLWTWGGVTYTSDKIGDTIHTTKEYTKSAANKVTEYGGLALKKINEIAGPAHPGFVKTKYGHIKVLMSKQLTGDDTLQANLLYIVEYAKSMNKDLVVVQSEKGVDGQLYASGSGERVNLNKLMGEEGIRTDDHILVLNPKITVKTGKSMVFFGDKHTTVEIRDDSRAFVIKDGVLQS